LWSGHFGIGLGDAGTGFAGKRAVARMKIPSTKQISRAALQAPVLSAPSTYQWPTDDLDDSRVREKSEITRSLDRGAFH
jgi:hypothetical protein